ncbi:uncharacterized protein LOC127286617 [Leptopilina boulardi]|uniref:uncharacterized protein LOC127286617 n=1 Tax=Leptopilina boulardi TaxID=63433 RepID=UPI0021F5DCBB|nr:uncharacterized protein LOC127286617 [Leptopilina boulardi]
MYYFAILFCTLFVPFAQSLHVPSVVQFENKSEISEFNKIIDTNSESIPDKQNNFKSRLIRQALPMLVSRPMTNFRPISYPPQTSSKPITITTGPAISYPPQTSSKPIIITTGPAISYPPQTSSKPIIITTGPAISYPPQTSSKPITITSVPGIIRGAYPYNFSISVSAGAAMAICDMRDGKYVIKTCTNVKCTFETCQNGHCTTKETRSNGAHVSCP